MKNLKLFFSIALALIISTAAFAQGRINGKVVEIIDGKTVVIETGNLTLLTAELQYIEVPETGQPLNQTVKDHLRALIEGKVVEFRAKGLTRTKTVGQLFLNGIDISQQMIRDGAAWHAVQNKSGQDAAESDVYQSNETQAKNEKLGIWSIENLKPSWQVRAEAEENRRRAETLAQQKQQTAENAAQANAASSQRSARPQQPQRQMNGDSITWIRMSEASGKEPENSSGVGDLTIVHTDKMGVVATPLLKFAVSSKDKVKAEAIGMVAQYHYYDDARKGREILYVINIECDTRNGRFLKSNDLIITADNRKIVIKKAMQLPRLGDSLVKEVLMYHTKRSIIEAIANAKNVDIKIGTYSTTLNSDVQMMLKNFINASE